MDFKTSLLIAASAIALCSCKCNRNEEGRIQPVMYSQNAWTDTVELGDLVTLEYEGTIPAASCPGIRYELSISCYENSGNGRYELKTTYLEAENGKDESFSEKGRRLTVRNPEDSTVIWRLIPDDETGEKIDLLVRNDSTVTILGNKKQKTDNGPLYDLKLAGKSNL